MHTRCSMPVITAINTVTSAVLAFSDKKFIYT